MLNSVTNALRVNEFIVERGEAGISEIARALDLTVGTTYRLVATLAEAGYVEQNLTNRRYRPGPKIAELARQLRGTGDFLHLAHGRLVQLKTETNETVNLGVLREGSVVYIDRAVTDQPLAVAVQIGSRVPAYCTSLGRAMLAYSDDETVNAYLKQLPKFAKGQPQKPPATGELRTILESARSAGYAEDNGEFAPDIACFAAPILDSMGKAAAAVSVSGPRVRITERRKELVPSVLTTAGELSELLQSLGDSMRI
jgi:IclR family transcriptional regulator, KDG regulon repressor